LKDWLAADDRFKDIQPLSDDSNLTGSWQVSVRHQNDCLVANGYMICGDAAWFPNPISAGGIGPGLIGGVMAGETAVRAIEANDFSEKQLWQYNLDFVNHYGNKTAGLEVFRMYLQRTRVHDEQDASAQRAIPELSKGSRAVRRLESQRRFDPSSRPSPFPLNHEQ
jgi:flavin-dependent dehydrogenase